jgi:small subunit ribosomal protein S6
VREYESTLIIQPEISDEGVGALHERLDGALEGFGSIRLLYDDLGKRRLAYEIQNFQKGRYVMLRFLDEGSNIMALERALGLEDSIIRFLIVQVTDAVEDVAARQAEAAEEERLRAEKAAERAAREAEEAERQKLETAKAEELAAAEREAASQKAAAAAEESKDTAGESESGEAVAAEGEPSEPVAAESKPVAAEGKPAVAESKPVVAEGEATADEEPVAAAKDDESAAPIAAKGEAAEAASAEEVVG